MIAGYIVLGSSAKLGTKKVPMVTVCSNYEKKYSTRNAHLFPSDRETSIFKSRKTARSAIKRTNLRDYPGDWRFEIIPVHVA